MFNYNFELQNEDNNKGTVYLPNKKSKNIPVIIYCHGWGGSRKLWKPTEQLCKRAMTANMALVTFDFYGCGETGGEYSQMTYKRWKENLSDIVSWCIEQPFAAINKIGFYSFSSGTTAALRLAAEDSRIAFIVSVGTCISSHIGMKGGGPAKIFVDYNDELRSGGTKEFFGVAFGTDFYADTISNAPIYSIMKIKCPTLFLQGLQDNPYRCADSKMAYQIMKNEGLPVAYIEIENGSHELDNVATEAMEHLFNWFSVVV